AFLDHAAGASAAAQLFGGLEDKMNRAVEVPPPRNDLGGGQQDRGMAVMAAGMHGAWYLACPFDAIAFLYRQGVHIGAQADAAAGVAVSERTQHARAGDAFRNVVAQSPQTISDHAGSAELLETEFGMAMDVSPERDVGVPVDDGV